MWEKIMKDKLLCSIMFIFFCSMSYSQMKLDAKMNDSREILADLVTMRESKSSTAIEINNLLFDNFGIHPNNGSFISYNDWFKDVMTGIIDDDSMPFNENNIVILIHPDSHDANSVKAYFGIKGRHFIDPCIANIKGYVFRSKYLRYFTEEMFTVILCTKVTVVDKISQETVLDINGEVLQKIGK
jgi:hypothetical protein